MRNDGFLNRRSQVRFLPGSLDLAPRGVGFGSVCGSVEGIHLLPNVGIRHDRITVKHAPGHPSTHPHNLTFRKSLPLKLSGCGSSKVVEQMFRPHNLDLLLEFPANLDRFDRAGQSGLVAGSLPGLPERSNRKDVFCKICHHHMSRHYLIAETMQFCMACQRNCFKEAAQFGAHRKDSRGSALGAASVQPNLTPDEIDITPAKVLNFRVPPTRQEGKQDKRAIRSLQVRPEAIHLFPRQESGSRVRFLQVGNMGHMQDLAVLHREFEGVLDGLQFPVNRAGFGVLGSPVNDVLIQLCGGYLRSLTPAKDGNDVQPEAGLDVIVGLPVVYLIIRRHIDGQFTEKHSVGLAGSRQTFRQIGKALGQFQFGMIPRLKRFKLTNSVQIVIADSEGRSTVLDVARFLPRHSAKESTSLCGNFKIQQSAQLHDECNPVEMFKTVQFHTGVTQ